MNCEPPVEVVPVDEDVVPAAAVTPPLETSVVPPDAVIEGSPPLPCISVVPPAPDKSPPTPAAPAIPTG